MKKENNKDKLKTPFEEFKDAQQVVSTLNQIYTDDEIKYRDFFLKRLEQARDDRNQNHDELDGMSYPDYYETNLKAGISYIPPRMNKEDVSIVTGTTREKKLAIMATVLNLNFETEVHAYDKENMEDVKVGQALTDCIKKSEEWENWEDEMKLLAYDELTTQGNVFVEDNYIVEYRWDKVKVKLEDLKLKNFQDFKPEFKKEIKFKGCKRNVIPGIFVYLGNIKEFNEQNQPFIFTLEALPYEEAKRIYGKWPRWEHVPKSFEQSTDDPDVYGMNWRLEESTPEGWVEVIKYQDKWNDEYQISLNGVLQLPVGFPMPWESGDYNIAKGNLEPISPNFAICKSVPAKTKVDQQVLDEMYKLAILKTQKSFMPPIANYSQQVLTRSAFLPGKVNNDLQKGEIEVLGGNPNLYALNSAELQMIQMIKDFIDEKSINPVAAGQSPQGNPTATEVVQVQNQAKVRLGLMIFGFMALHKKLGYIRNSLILENYTKPSDTVLDKVRDTIKNKYMKFTIPAEIDGSAAERQVEFTEEFKNPMDLIDEEEGITRDGSDKIIGKKKQDKKKRIIQINPIALRNFKYYWRIDVSATERETSLATKLVFNQNLSDAYNLFGPEAINQDYARQRWATINKIEGSKFFMPAQSTQMPAAVTEAMPVGEVPEPAQGKQDISKMKPQNPTTKEMLQQR